jgi:hypothetical protein
VLLGDTIDMGTQNAAVTADGWLATLTGQLPNSIYKSIAKQRALRVKSVQAKGKKRCRSYAIALNGYVG